jgi:outer membrane protein assembly factor BamB
MGLSILKLLLGRTQALLLDRSMRLLFSFKVLDGSQLWSAPAPGIANAFALTDSVYFVGGSATGVSAYRISDGALLWKNTDPMLSRFTAVGNTVYINTFRGSVLALASDTGKQVWEAQVGGPGGVPIVANGMLYVAAGRGAGRVVAINASTGAIPWRAPVAGTPSALVLAGGTISRMTRSPTTDRARKCMPSMLPMA